MRGALAAVLSIGVSFAVPPVSFAHPEVDGAAAEVTNGNYEAALPLLDALLQRDDLDLTELTTVLELRALLFRGMDDDAALDGALRALAVLAPDHRFDARHPPDLESRASQLRTSTPRLALRANPSPSAVGVRLLAEVENDPDHLVREIRYRVFNVGSAQWTVASPPVEAAPGREVLVFVEAIGPGGAVVLRSGSVDAPIRLSGPRPDPLAPLEPNPSSDGWVPWVIGGVVLVVLAGVAIGLGVGLSDTSVTWRPTAPREVP